MRSALIVEENSHDKINNDWCLSRGCPYSRLAGARAWRRRRRTWWWFWRWRPHGWWRLRWWRHCGRRLRWRRHMGGGGFGGGAHFAGGGFRGGGARFASSGFNGGGARFVGGGFNNGARFAAGSARFANANAAIQNGAFHVVTSTAAASIIASAPGSQPASSSGRGWATDSMMTTMAMTMPTITATVTRPTMATLITTTAITTTAIPASPELISAVRTAAGIFASKLLAHDDPVLT